MDSKLGRLMSKFFGLCHLFKWCNNARIFTLKYMLYMTVEAVIRFYHEFIYLQLWNHSCRSAPDDLFLTMTICKAAFLNLVLGQ